MVERQELMSVRFTNAVMNAFQSGGLDIQATQKQKELVQGYFIAIEKALSAAEEKRLKKNANNKDHKYDELVPYAWENVNLRQLALDVMHYSKMGLDVTQKNMIHVIPFKNNLTQKYDINLMEGYNGIKYKALKYGMDVPVNVIVELIYETDEFEIIKKDSKHEYEGYSFQIKKPFNRGKIVGGFGYYEYDDKRKNKVVLMTVKDIEKRKPAKASAEFWGGTKTEWIDGKKQETQTEGWYEEMCLKTLKRYIYSEANIPLDPNKIDEDYQYVKAREIQQVQSELDTEKEKYANRDYIDAEITEKKEPEQIATQSEALQQAPKFDEKTGEVLEAASVEKVQQRQENSVEMPQEDYLW